MTRYPIGIQTFEKLRMRKCVYVDKTGYIHRLVNSGSCTFFLSRPRRFGKSLLLSTLDAYFSGKKELFEGLEIYDLETEWQSYPVIRFDFSRSQAKSPEDLTEFIRGRLSHYEKKYDITDTVDIKDIGLRFGTLIERISEVTGKELVILVDEYDKGIHEVLENEEQLRANQDVLRPFFSQIKAQEEFLRFCMITGVARFRNYTIFSGFNNPDDLSLDPRYAAICGITKSELIDSFSEGIQALANKLDLNFEQTLETLRQKYDGYRFTEADVMVYNPFSIINCLDKQMVNNYWLKSGTPKIFVDYLSKSQFQVLELENIWTTFEAMEGTYSSDNPIPLLFQTGYLTIAEVNYNTCRLRIPNGEVRSTLVEDIIPRYMGVAHNVFSSMMNKLNVCLHKGDVEGFMNILQSLVAQIPYQQMDIENLERTYHLVIYELFLILGVDARSEVSMSGGRIDVVVQTIGYVYVMEFKLGGSSKVALDQIDEKGYSLPWRADGRTVYKIGVVFSPVTRTIGEWVLVKC